MIPLNVFIGALIGVVFVAGIICMALQWSRDDWRSKSQWRDGDIKDLRSQIRDAERAQETLRKRHDMVCDERAFWRSKAIVLGYPAAGDE